MAEINLVFCLIFFIFVVEKKRIAMRDSFLYLIIILSVLTSCSEGMPTYHIAMSQCAGGQWREKVNREMLAAQHLYNVNMKVDICDAEDDTQRQIHQIDSLAEAGIDLLVVAPTESAPVAKAIQRVRDRGIPVVFFDRRATTEDYTAFIGGNNVETGRTVGEYVVSLTRGQDKVPAARPLILEVTGAMSTSPAQERHEGFARVMREHPELDYMCCEGDWTSDEACRLAKKQITEGRLPAVVFCHNDGMATGVYKAVVETGKEGLVKIIGIDGLPYEGIEYVQLGHQVGTYVYPTHGEEVVRLAVDILTGRPFKRNNELQGMMVTPENADIIAMSSRELIKQNDHLITIHDKLEANYGLYNTQRKVIIGTVVAIILLVIAVILTGRALWQTRRTLRQRQQLNEEQTIFYTDASRRQLTEIFEEPRDVLKAPRSQDMIFAEHLNEAMRKHMSNPALKMEELGEELGLGRVQLYRRVKSITGLSPVELLRQLRLQRAYALLGSTTKTIGEIAYEVGFGTPAYFSKCFRKQYGKYPSEVRESLQQKCHNGE